jgi:hypothetical protein
MKTVTKKRVYATPDFELQNFVVEKGFAISYEDNDGTENFGKYPEIEL